jgi:hypothetical protein
MAGMSGEEENHWPGYVDALTTMTMMLIFIMTILAVAIFGLSQNVSRGMIEKIAKVVKIDDLDSSESTDHLAARVMAKIESQPSPTMIAEAPRQALPPAEPDVENRLVSSAEAARAADAKAAVDMRPALITITFQKRATGIDSETSDKIKAVMAEGGRNRKPVELKAFAEKTGAVSDSRRVAFYRLLNLRTQLIAMGVPAEMIRARIEDAQDSSTGDLVHIDVAAAG